MKHFRTLVFLVFLTTALIALGAWIGNIAGLVIGSGLAIILNLVSYYYADSLLLRMYQAQRLTEGEVVELVQYLAKRANIPMPKVYLIAMQQPNAFATGRNPDHGAVAVTQGLLAMLTKEEVAAVIAHELAHIKNYDTLTMTLAATLAGAITMLLHAPLYASDVEVDSDMLQDHMALRSLLSVTSPFIAVLVQMAISRSREYEADRLGGIICGNPLALASALKKIEGAAPITPNRIADRNPASAHLFIHNPLRTSWIARLFSTHPGTEERIAALTSLQQSHGKALKSRFPWG